MWGFVSEPLFSQFAFFLRFVDFFMSLLSMSLSQFSQGGGRVVEGVSDTKPGSSCLYLLLFLLFVLLLPVMPAVAGLLLLF